MVKVSTLVWNCKQSALYWCTVLMSKRNLYFLLCSLNGPLEMLDKYQWVVSACIRPLLSLFWLIKTHLSLTRSVWHQILIQQTSYLSISPVQWTPTSLIENTANHPLVTPHQQAGLARTTAPTSTDRSQKVIISRAPQQFKSQYSIPAGVLLPGGRATV